MASREKAVAMVAMTCLAATVSILAVTTLYWRRRRRRQGQEEEEVGVCWLEIESKPQNSFKRVLADNSYTPYTHLKREGKEKEISLKLHPYEDEITFLLEQPPSLLNFVINQEPPNMEVSYVWVCTQPQLGSLAEVLGKEQVFAVDTEQHNFRSFLGFTALMQISTQKTDFLLDTIALHDMMGILQPVFSNPSICKVFHGSDNDVLWLQRDFHIYVVNLFDTAKACQVLGKPQKSLAYLLETYCGVTTNKALQREDWRMRPLPAKMVEYARTDAHYLLYIADCLVSELKMQSRACGDDKSNFVFEARRHSNMVCMQLYAKDIESSPGDSAASSILSRYWNVEEITYWKNCETRELVRQLCTWRDLMVVKTYFGGREISEEDLETALVIGMSPQERRKLERKRGLPFKSCKAVTERSIITSDVVETFELNIRTSHTVQVSQNSKCVHSEDIDLPKGIASSQLISSTSFEQDIDSQYNVKKSFKSDGEQKVTKHIILETSNDAVENQQTSFENGISSCPSKTHSIVSRKYAKKVSLLGHGPHGRQVVEHILKEYGEDGILQFCQRWRQVFVEAIHPRFLPSGWDIMHSGRREFGKYSVYNPAYEDREEIEP